MVLAVAAPATARQDSPVVRGVLFFSPTCGHCEYVIQEVLPPLYDQHGGPWDLVYDTTLPETDVAYYLLTNGTLEMLLVDVTIEAGAMFFEATTQALSIGSNGVPRLVVSNQVMIGSADIPNRLPGLIESGLAGDGIAWPAIPGIDAVLDTLPSSATTTTTTSVTTTTGAPVTTTTAAPVVTLPVSGEEGRSFGDDAVANSIAVGVLALLLIGLGTSYRLLRRDDLPYRPGALVLPLTLFGLLIAGYLTFVEVTGDEAVCGPVGDCNVVQQSDYATVAGIPIGVVGLVGYLVIGGLWVAQRSRVTRRNDLARVALALVTVAGVSFTAWLTFLEPFVIHATCVWCLGSAVVIGALMWLTVPAGIAAWRRLAPR